MFDIQAKSKKLPSCRLQSIVLLCAMLVSLSGCSSIREDSAKLTDSQSNQSIDSDVTGDPKANELLTIYEYFFADPLPLPSRSELQQGQLPTAYVQAGDNDRAVIALGNSGPYGEIWYSGGQALRLAHGRVIGSGDVAPADLIMVTNLAADPLRCIVANGDSNCERSWQRTVDIRPSKLVEASYQRGDVIVSYQVSSTFSVQGDTVTETGTATDALGDTYSFENTFTLSNGRVSQSRQWFSPQLGYIDYDVAKMPDTAEQVRYEAPAFVFTASSGNRLSLLLENEVVAPRLSAEHYWPLLRIHNDSLQQKFEARKQGMLMRLRLLREYYNGESQSELAAATQELLEAFQSWPLRATYQHGVEPPQMLINFADNPYLNPADAGDSGQYTVSIPVRPDGPHGHRLVGLSDASAAEFALPAIYDVQPNGSIQAHAEPDAMLVPLPGHATVRLQSIPDARLPLGFRDLNYQLALFLQHWDWAADAASNGGAE